MTELAIIAAHLLAFGFSTTYVVIDATKQAIRTGEVSFAIYALTELTFLLALAQATILTLRRTQP